MYEYLDNSDSVKVIGSFSHDKNSDFKDSVKHLLESFQSSYQMDAIADISKILRIDTLKEAYKEELLHDVAESAIDDPYYSMMPEKLEQLFENSSLEILQESGVAALAPIVGISLPILKKSYIEGHSKDIVMTEVPSKPIIKAAFERRFLKDAAGTKYYIPDVFYDDTYKTIMNKGKGKAVSSKWYPEGDVSVPFQDLNILVESGGSIATRDTLAYDFCIKAVQMDIGESDPVIVNVNVQPNFAANSSFTAEIKTTTSAGDVVKDILIGQVDQYNGLVSVGCTGGKIVKVQFGGHLSNENNTETIEVDRERELLEWKIPDGTRINTGLTLEKIKDYKALFDFDITTEIISDMSTVLSQYEDSEILGFLNDSYDSWKTRNDLPFGYGEYLGSFTEEGYFSCEPPANKFVTRSQWIDSELKYDLNRFIDELKVKLRNQELMFVVYGHPNNVTLIQDNVHWIIDEDTKIGGIQLDYKFGVMTANKNRIHVISTMKCPKARGLRVVAYPLTKEIVTFKHYKYSLNIENAYRNALTPLTPNIMGTSRFITTEVLPIQGEFHIIDNMFALRSPDSPATAQVATPVISLASGSYADSQTITVSCATPGVNVYYTLDGTEPVIGTSPLLNATITVSATATLKVIAAKPNMIPSNVVTADYTIGG